AVGEDDRLDVVDAVAQIGEVRQHEVDSEHLRGWKHQARIDDDDPTVVLDDGHVLTDLAQAAQRQDAQRSAWHYRSTGCKPTLSRPARTVVRCSSSAGTSGSRRVSPGIRPIIARAALTGIGLVVTARAA